MTSEKMAEFTDKFGKAVSKNQLNDLENKLENAEEEVLEKIEQTKIKSTFITVMLSAFFGLFGAGSFYLGRIKAGILKLVFNVLVPITALIIFIVWLAPVNKLYYNQSFDVARSVYSIMGSEKEYKGYTSHILVVAPWTIDRVDNIKTAFDKEKGTVTVAVNAITSAENIQVTNLKDAAAVKTVLDGLNLQEVLVDDENTALTVKIYFGELPEYKVSALDSFGEKFTAISEKATNLIKDIEKITIEDEEIKGALSKIKLPVEEAQKALETLLGDNSSNLLTKTIYGIKSDITYFSNELKADLEAYRAKITLEKSVEKKLNFNERFTKIFAHLNSIPTKDDLNEVYSEISTSKTEINALSSDAIAAAKIYYLNGEYATWLPGVFLMIDGIVILCWWIGEVFNDREKCQNYNYQKLVEVIQ